MKGSFLMADKIKIDENAPVDAVKYMTPDGVTFLAPPTANFPAIYAYGKLISTQPLSHQKAAIGAAVSHYGFYDFQRQAGTFYSAYTDASNYAVGVVMSGAGYSWAETEAIAATFATFYSSQGWTSRQTKWWHYGFSAAADGHLPPPPYPTAVEIHRFG
jgi:hypothetical protein